MKKKIKKILKRKHRQNPDNEALAVKEAYKGFHWGDEVDEHIKLTLKIPKKMFNAGMLHAVEYETHKDGETAIFRHVWKKKNRPFLASDPEGTQLFILDGVYEVRPEGITD
jgi:hypothetical protein